MEMATTLEGFAAALLNVFLFVIARIDGDCKSSNFGRLHSAAAAAVAALLSV